MNKTFIAIVCILIVGVGIFLLTRSQSTPKTPIPQSQTSTDGLPSAPQTDFYDFSKGKYEEALNSDKLIVLYFYANWCPICKEEVPKLYSAFNELTTDKVIGFRVNFNDSDTDSDEENLAREFGVAYQHTKVFVKNGSRVLKSPESWEKDRYLDEIQKAL